MKVRIGGVIAAVVAVAMIQLFAGCSSNKSPAQNDAGSGGTLGTGGAPGSGGGAGGAGVGGHGTGGTPATGGAGGADAGAGGEDGGDAATSQPDGGGSDGSADAPAPTLTQIWTTILSVITPADTAPSCIGCHDGSPGIPDYTSVAKTYQTWVNVASTSCPPGIRVTPGNAETSVLINKLRAKPNLGLGVTVCGGDPMPALPDAHITLDQLHMIEAWINAGALNN